MSNQGFYALCQFPTTDYVPSWLAQNNIHVQLQAQQQAALNERPSVYWWHREPMTPGDLGIVDQLLDDKVGMEP